ncbi:hypothetical protein [uncultured Caballeronia sp.]|uniref:hypothetical protein n=1 Tax=uncultured Caballeronia sp. TaxID=1827198 RepID=UPI0035CB6452
MRQSLLRPSAALIAAETLAPVLAGYPPLSPRTSASRLGCHGASTALPASTTWWHGRDRRFAVSTNPSWTTRAIHIRS